ncbi:MAG: GNAT family N-acetyltransferase [Tahibacter sp.]
MIIDDDFRVEPADWHADNAGLRFVRTDVFINEQQIPEDEEWDALDAQSIHVIARDNNNQPIATGRLTPDHKIGRMAVIKAWRGKHVGDAIMRALVQRAQQMGYPTVELSAQSYAIPFYAKLGFVAYGDEYLDCNIPHRMMRMELTAAEAPYKPVARLLETPVPRLITVDSRAEAQACVVELLSLAHRELCIYTRDLDAELFDTEAALEQFRRIGVAGRGASVRIVVQQAGAALRDGHRLIPLAQRLTSVFQFRTPESEEDRHYPSAFLLTDRRSYYFRVLGSRYEGEAHTYFPGRHAQLQETFNQVWERCVSSEELRHLYL